MNELDRLYENLHRVEMNIDAHEDAISDLADKGGYMTDEYIRMMEEVSEMKEAAQKITEKIINFEE